VTWRTTLVGLALIALPLATVDSSGLRQFDTQQLTLTIHDGQAPGHFTVEGTPVKGLYPGAVRQIKLTVVNPERSALRIDRLRGRVVATSRRGCPVSGLRVDGYDGKLPARVQAHGRTTLPGRLVVTMPADTTPNCSGTKFTIELVADGARTGR
jgi:hypothetical protein